MSNQPNNNPDLSDVPTGMPDGMFEVGSEGRTPSDIMALLLGGEYKDILSVIMRTNFTAEECMPVVKTLNRAKFGLGLIIKDSTDKRWAMPWLRDAVVHLAMTRMSTNFHSIDKVIEGLSSMKQKTEQTIRMNQI